jgi:putative tricarboxylic transport membrane protein
MLIFGFLGYILRRLDYEPAPLVLAFVLGPMLEKNFRQALQISDGSPWIFLTQPLSAICLLVSLFLLLSAVIPFIARRREEVVTDE